MPIAVPQVSKGAILSLALLREKAVVMADTCTPDFEEEVAAFW